MCQRIGLDATRHIHDPDHAWLGAKISNWIYFFGVNPDNWEVTEAGGTAWISRLPFSDVRGLEKNMPNMPKKSEVKEWYKPTNRKIKETFDSYDVVFIGGIEGPLSNAYIYADTTTFCQAILTLRSWWTN